MKRLSVLVFLILAVFTLFAFADKEPLEEKEGPYFAIEDKSGVENFPLLETKADVKIAGMIAEVELTQVYKNDGNKTIEAVYVFPLGTQSAIYAMRMKIGTRIIEAEINEKKKAQKIYEQAKEDGKVVSLLEQERPNVFQMKVANIMPGDTVEVTVSYIENIVPEEGIYEFVFPTVVGPRYTGESDKKDLKGKDKWVSTPYTHEGDAPKYNFDIKVKLETGIPISRVWCDSHKVIVKNINQSAVEVSLEPEQKNKGNKDFILRYNLQGDAIQSGILMYPGKKENFFLVMMEPPKRVDPKDIPPREYVFVIDVSGSMHGFPLKITKKLIKQLLESLRSEDYFNILFFSGGSKVLSETPIQATKGNIQKAMDMLDKVEGGGGTQILQALERTVKLPKKEGMSRIVVIATDGYVSVEKKTFDIITEKMNEMNVFSFGIGTSVNRYLIEGMARVGKGVPFIATSEKEAEDVAAKFIDYIKSPILTDIKVKFTGFDAYDVEPVAMPDLFADRPLVFYGKYKHAYGQIIITGNTPSGKYQKEFTIYPNLASKDNEALMYLWAREKIARLGDYSTVGVEVSKEITELGLEYSLMTEYTSFVAVDKVIRDTGEVVTVKQPLPLPEGVSDLAVQEETKVSTGRKIKPGMKFSLPAPKPMPTSGERDEDEYGYNEAPVKREIFISQTIVPSGVSGSQVEREIEKQLKTDLEKLFKEWNLSKVKVELEIQNGVVKSVKFSDKKSDKFSESDLEKVFKQLKLDSSITGKIIVEIVY